MRYYSSIIAFVTLFLLVNPAVRADNDSPSSVVCDWLKKEKLLENVSEENVNADFYYVYEKPKVVYRLSFAGTCVPYKENISIKGNVDSNSGFKATMNFPIVRRGDEATYSESDGLSQTFKILLTDVRIGDHGELRLQFNGIVSVYENGKFYTDEYFEGALWAFFAYPKPRRDKNCIVVREPEKRRPFLYFTKAGAGGPF